MIRALAFSLAAALGIACGGSEGSVATQPDAAGSGADASTEAAPPPQFDSGSPSPPTEAGVDAAPPADASSPPPSPAVMFGGMDANGNALTQTWLYDGKAWIPSTAQGPSARFEHAMATLGSEVVLFGGTDGLHTLGDTWIFDGEHWTQGPSSGPPARNSHAMATLGKQIVLFGGADANNVSLSDTWLFDGKTWKQNTAEGPPARFWHSMAAVNGSVVLFGGTGTSGDLGDTWLFDGSGWSKVLPAKSPSARSVPSMASLKSTAYLFGGYAGLNAAFQEFGDTWRFDGVSWTQVTAKTAPSARAAGGMAYQNGGIILFGGSVGEDDSITYLQDTWRFDGSKWTAEPATGPPASDSQEMATQ